MTYNAFRNDETIIKKSKTFSVLIYSYINTSCRRKIIQPYDVQEYFVQDEHTKQFTCNKCDEKFSNSKKLVKQSRVLI